MVPAVQDTPSRTSAPAPASEVALLAGDGLTLTQLIPADAWARTGITKLSAEQQDALAAEITRLLTALVPSPRNIVVVAPSVSTSMKAREIRMAAGLHEVALRYATRVLVVVRSSLFDPLDYSYNSFGELEEDADNQLNISGPNYHVYVYDLDDDLRPSRVSHKSFEADD
jgi:hypothetical protein